MNQYKHIDPNHISEEIGIEKADLMELLSIYCSEMSQEMQCIKEQLDNQDWTNLQRTIHNVKGVSANLCIQSMYELSAHIDSMLKVGQLEGISSEIDKLFSTYNAVSSEIMDILESAN